jgi:hypothetical protein
MGRSLWWLSWDQWDAAVAACEAALPKATPIACYAPCYRWSKSEIALRRWRAHQIRQFFAAENPARGR